ncbi:hypothetical protein QOZ80_5BG0421040 [Eleusine coracana subsp. coracana]|nr:hypothetical protein QOZ80_5BG0421040 [Eleusine coracana subsp. coracana]
MVFAFKNGHGSGVCSELLTARFARQVLSGRWFTLFACLLILSASGATYAFGVYSPALKSALGYDQRAIATLAFAKDLGSNVGLPAGLLLEAAPPWVVLAAGAAMNLAGYLMLYLSLSSSRGRLRPPVWLACVYVGSGAHLQAYSGTAALVTVVRNFPEARGAVLGLVKGYVGLSSAILAQIYLALYGGGGGGDPKSLVLLIAWLPAAVSVVFLRTVRVVPPDQRRRRSGGDDDEDGDRDGGVFFCLLYVSVLLATYILVMILVQRRVAFSRAASAAGLLLLLFLPILVLVKQEYKMKKKQDLDLHDEDEESVPRDAGPAIQETVVDVQEKENKPPAATPDYSISQAVFSPDMLLLFIAITCGAGGTLTAIDSMGQIGESLGYPPNTVATFVSLISVWNYAGRVAAGYASESLLTSRRRVPRPLMLTLVLLLSCSGHLLIALGAPRGTLYLASVLIGLCFGAQWPLLYATVSELFGLKRYPTLYNLAAMASSVGAYLLNVRVTGRVYDAEAARQKHRHGGTEVPCVGAECFRRSFLVVAGVAVAGAVVSLAIVWRTREFYRGDIYARFRTTAVDDDDESPQPAAGER